MGFTISAVYKKPLDLEIVKLTGYKDPETRRTEDGHAIAVGTSQTTANEDHYLCDTQAHSVTFRYKNREWSFNELKINNEFASKISNIKSETLFGVDLQVPPITIGQKIKKDGIMAKLGDIALKYV
ncbi:hypothetical protein IL306_009720 [Fusarium sp. DS 682]|nr:hypothetical protein IL306_009720 [Fusarium sp. DS 682]